MSNKLSAEQAEKRLESLNGWTILDGYRLHKGYKFPDFAQALAFVNSVGEVAETQRHHPNIGLTWGQVTIDIWTHSVDGLTEKDFTLAQKLDAAYADRE
jgi:4a-hydroxytetrahydrobiopterin dehydratase